ncbi:GNAT family N-acetyltransferase [Marinifilum sp. D714]|uniref:GNAT family N-acetyltransferase n=1 Tax=Marinifilum sp. D714 TaxID=2937523 RepID=UPI0027C956CB|nr:GNAT family N-acetyltransferase [Marinifilum sp. D714]MDQ2178694.1 GNAT family N-acetyltransferase [Marinifilum sp. D714]
MITIKLMTSFLRPEDYEKKELLDFLYEHLEEYGDDKADIEKAIQYALKETPSMGGFTIVAKLENEIVGAVVVNRTGMEGYIPENILVYIATHKQHRGKGIGKKLMEETMKIAKGSIALHVEPDNPAKHLYEKMGFENKYLEMRFTK